MEELRFDTPWLKIDTETGLPAQLYKEVSKDHVLHGKKVTAIAQRQDREDVLFLIPDENRYALVHLTWAERQLDRGWPDTALFDTMKEVQEAIDRDIKDWRELEDQPLNEIGGFVEGKKRIIIVGASSGIGKEMAKQYALDGNIVAITGRREELLEKMRQSFGGRIIYSAFDVTAGSNTKRIEELVQRLNGLDILIYSSGVGGPSKDLEWQLDKLTVDTNVNGFIEIANWGFNYFIKQGNGSMAVISSIAANRGNSWAPAYGASKAFQSNYFEALAIKAKRMKKDMGIICIEPGFVDTKMVKGYKRFWVVPLEKAARQIISGIEKKKQKVYVSKRWWLVAKLMRLTPFWLYKKIG